MQEKLYWDSWAQFLQRFGLTETAATLLEASGPLTVLLAQFVYIGAPLAGVQTERWRQLGGLLEDRTAAHSFAAYLRGEVSEP